MAKKKSQNPPPSTKANVTIEGRGICIAYQNISKDEYDRLVRNGISQEECDELESAVYEDVYLEALLIDDACVTINNEQFVSSWNKISVQFGGQLPLAKKLHGHAGGSPYRVLREEVMSGTWASEEIENFDPMKLHFDLEHVQTSFDTRCITLTAYYNGDDIAENLWTEGSGSNLYIVDSDGNRFEIKINE